MPDGQNYGGQPPSDLYDAELVIHALSDAGATLVALWVQGIRPAGYGSGMPEYGHDEEDMKDQLPDPEKIAQPNAKEVTQMDKVLDWIKLIPDSKIPLRRVIGYRMLTNVRTEKPLMSWARIALEVGTDKTNCERMYENGVDLIVSKLNEPIIRAAQKLAKWSI